MADVSVQFPTPGAAGPEVSSDVLPVRPEADDVASRSRAFVCVLGGPGSGKTSQCKTAAAQLGYTHLCLGQLLKQESQSGSSDSDEIAECMKAGTLVPTPVVLRVLQRHLEQSTGPVLLDGFPRVVDQMDKLSELGNVLGVLFLDCEEAVLRERMDKTDCDDEVALIAQFTDHCLPVLDLYDKEGLVQVVDASASAEVVEVSLQKLIQSVLDGHILSPQEAAHAADDVTAPAPESESAAPSAEDGDIAMPQEAAPAVDDSTATVSETAPSADSIGSAPEPESAGLEVSSDVLPVRPEADVASRSRAFVCVLGGPGSGKTSQCKTAAAQLGYTHLCLGQLLKQESQSGSSDSDEIAECMKAGTLVPTPVVLRVLQRHLEQSTGPVLLDGFPRVVDQMDKLSELGNVLGVLFLDCEEAVLRERMDKTDCDDEVALIAQFTDHCLPVLDLYDKEGLVQVVDASASAEVVEVSLQKLIQSVLDGHILSPQEAAHAADDVTAPAPESESAAPSAEDGDIAMPQEAAPAVDDSTATVSETAPSADSIGSAPEPESAGLEVSSDVLPVRPEADVASRSRAFVCVLGGPGSGKTSQCKTAAAQLGYTHLCLGQLLKQESQSGSSDSDEIAECMKAGTLVPTPVVLRVLQRHLEQSTGPVLLDGFPRVVDQMDKLSELGNVLGVLFLDCEEAVLRERMDKTDCDDEVALIAQFTDHCLPVLDLYDKEGLVQVVDASASAEVVEVSLQKLIQSVLDGHILSPQEAAHAADDVTAPAPESESAAPSAEDGDIAMPQEAAPAVDDSTATVSETAPSADSIGSAPEPEAPVEAVSGVLVPSVEEWGENVFKQFDTDKDGRLSKKEMARALRSLPKKKPKSAPPGAKFMSVDDLMAAMDSDDNGTIDLQEWVENLASCAGLAAAIAENVDEAGEIPTFRSFEQQQAKCKAEVLELEAKDSRTEEDEALLTDLKLQIENLQAKIEEAAANQLKLNEWGRSTFEQFDTDNNGQLSPQELATALKALPRRKPKNIPPGSKFMSIEEMMEAMDADGDGTINVDEWLSRLGQCAGLAAALAENVGEDGKLSNFVASSPTKTETVLEPEPEPEAMPQLESEPAAPSAEEAALEALLNEDEEENAQASDQVEDDEEVADEGPTVQDELQTELQTMTVKQLKQRARDLGVDEDTIHDIDDADDIKTAAIRMVTAATPAPEPEPDTAEGRGKLKHEISLHPPPGGGVLANLRAHSQRLDAVEGGLITEKLHKGKDGDDDLLEKLKGTSSKPKGKPTEEEIEAKMKEKAWLHEQKSRSLKLKEQALAKQDAWSADMQALRSRRRAKTAGKRWVTHSRVQRRVRYNEEQRANAATIEEKVQTEWSKFQQQHSQNLYSMFLLPKPTLAQISAAAEATDGGGGQVGDFGGRNPEVPPADQLPTLDLSTSCAAIGLTEDEIDVKTTLRLRKQARQPGRPRMLPPI